LRVCPRCDGVNEKAATLCISCGGALAAEPELRAGPAVVTHIAGLRVIDDNVIDLEATGLTWATNGRWKSNWPQGQRESALPEHIRPENIWQLNNRGVSSADLARLLRNIDEEIHRLDAHARPVLAAAPQAALQMPRPSEEPMATMPEPILFHSPLVTNGGVVEAQQFSWRGLVPLVIGAAIAIPSYLSLPSEPMSMPVGSVAADKRIGGAIAAAPPACDAMTANVFASRPHRLDKAIAATPIVVPNPGISSPAWPGYLQPGELSAAQLQAEVAPEALARSPYHQSGQ
jgi:hypothetical protein